MMNRSMRFVAVMCGLCLWMFGCSDGDLKPDIDAASPLPPDATVPPDAARPDAFMPPPECVQATDCDNGIYCDGAEACDPSGTCTPAVLGACDDGVACTVETCDEDAKTCARAPSDSLCSNGLFCDGVELCAETGCATGAPPETAPGVTCKNGRITAGSAHTCALLNGGQVYCWGRSNLGQLGHGNRTPIGDDEAAIAGGPVPFGAEVVVDIDAGDDHTCALLASGNVRCWGLGTNGRLGYGNTTTFGDDAGEVPATRGNVDVGGTVVQIAAGGAHTCALLGDGAVRCWGRNTVGQLGYGNTTTIGDNEVPSSVGAVDLGGTAVQITAGRDHTCALLEGGSVRCWGEGTLGRLGYGSSQKVGDNELPSTRGPVDLGGTAVQIAAGGSHTCAVLDTGAVRCWGFGDFGQLGYGNRLNVGDSAARLPSAAGDVPVGAPVEELVLGDNHSCARLESRAVRCWGRGDKGELGYGNTDNLGDDEVLALPDIDLGDPTVHLATGGTHNCALLEGGAVRCWGNGGDGRLGYGNVTVIGDDETPQSAGNVTLP